uniref:Uncharacterized protein n=1 Tax=Oryza barthii TaxID=65489 RepID=A0A0D3ELY9_9ORYZ
MAASPSSPPTEDCAAHLSLLLVVAAAAFRRYPHVRLAMLHELAIGDNLTIPLRCACPSLPQVAVVVAAALDMACPRGEK